MNCQDALSLLYDVIDKEASQIDTKEVQKHLDHCQDCYQKYQIEGALTALIKEKSKESSDLEIIERLKSKVKVRLEELDVISPGHSKKNVIPFRLPAVGLAAAAAVILLVAAGIWAIGLYRHYVDYIPLEKAHWAAAANLDNYKDAQKTKTLLAGLNDAYGITLEHNKNGMEMIGGQHEEVDGVQFAHFVYGNGPSTVSYFVASVNDFNIPESAKSSRVEINGDCYLDHDCRGCRLVYHIVGDAIIISATTDRSIELLEFAPEINII